jgi:polyhydroxyalkanoate synthase
MARDGDDRLASITLLAAQTDFSEPGEIRLLVDEAQVTFLEDMMGQTGVMPGKFMGSGFKALRPDDQIWGAAVRSYLMGEPAPLFDILVWNEDTTRMPYQMMSEYLRGLYLENRLARGRFMVDGAAVSISDIRAPIFAVGTSTDHVAPWRSVFKITRLADTSVTFVLTNGGHNAGIVSEPGHKGRHFRIGQRVASDHYLSPDAWLRAAVPQDGSWWLAWRDWLISHQSKERIAPPKTGAKAAGYGALCPAPGEYVLQR